MPKRDRQDIDEQPDVITTAGCYHKPVLLKESIEALDIKPNGVYIDVTFGGGGHSKEILSHLGSEGHLFGFDRDIDAQANCEIRDSRFTFVRSDFRFISHFMDYYGIDKVDGILADLGVSSHHLDDESRGFSFRYDAAIDMRMNQAGGITAKELINDLSVEELAKILKEYGEVKGSFKIAQRVKEANDEGKLNTVKELVETISTISQAYDKKSMARIFQALRIAVNDEMGSLRTLLTSGSQLLSEGGKFAIITYHSLEDRPVKNFFKTGNIEGVRHTDLYGVAISPFLTQSSKPIVPGHEEIVSNPRSRSAKLRVVTKGGQ